jgi:hypothetical protein
MTSVAAAAMPAIVPAMSFSDLFNDPQQMGLAVLIFVSATFIGVVVSRMVPRDKGPTLFGTLAALAVVGGLAYLGVEAAAYILWIFLAGAILLGAFALFTG